MKGTDKKVAWQPGGRGGGEGFQTPKSVGREYSAVQLQHSSTRTSNAFSIKHAGGVLDRKGKGDSAASSLTVKQGGHYHSADIDVVFGDMIHHGTS